MDRKAGYVQHPETISKPQFSTLNIKPYIIELIVQINQKQTKFAVIHVLHGQEVWVCTTSRNYIKTTIFNIEH